MAFSFNPSIQDTATSLSCPRCCALRFSAITTYSTLVLEGVQPHSLSPTVQQPVALVACRFSTISRRFSHAKNISSLYWPPTVVSGACFQAKCLLLQSHRQQKSESWPVYSYISCRSGQLSPRNRYHTAQLDWLFSTAVSTN